MMLRVSRMCELSSHGDPHHGPVLDTDVFVGCVRCPLGCAGSTDPTVCAVSVLGWLVGSDTHVAGRGCDMMRCHS